MTSRITDIPESDKRRIYLDNNYKKFYIATTGSEDPHSKEFEQLYRNTHKQKLPFLYWDHEKIYFHPDATYHDFEYIDDRRRMVPKAMFFSVISCIGLIMSYYWDKRYIAYYRKNPKWITASLIAFPPISMVGAYYSVNSWIDTKVRSFDWMKKYELNNTNNSDF